MNNVEFRKEIVTAEFLNPLRGFERDAKSIEYRSDPLTGYSSRVSTDRAKRVKQAQGVAVDVADIAASSTKSCCFCPANIDRDTTKFAPGFLSGGDGRIAVGGCALFPNLHPFTEFHAVARLTELHYLELDEFTPKMIEDNLAAVRKYIAAVNRHCDDAVYPVWLWNHLPPSGASIMHPHAQVSVERAPVPELEVVLRKSKKYLRENGVSFWQELIDTERKAAERFIGENASVAVLASFAPRGNREVQIISKRVSNLADFDKRHTHDFAEAVIRVLRGYKMMGMNSFNLVTYSAAIGDPLEHFRFSARIMSRPVFQPLYTNDTGSIERFYGISIIEAMPEQVAFEMRKKFEG
jgi:UDPglucose--hexose-1-phosphate uridylyltransferase